FALVQRKVYSLVECFLIVAHHESGTGNGNVELVPDMDGFQIPVVSFFDSYLGFLPGQLLFEDLICRSNKSLQHLFVPALDHQQLRRCGADLSSVGDAASCKPVDNLRIARTQFPLEVRDQLAEAAKVRRPIKLTNAFNGLELLEQMIVLN